MYQKLYKHFLNQHKNELHFTAHSHHYWPDITRKAQLAYWDDSAKLIDDKWNHIFSKVIPECKSELVAMLNIKSENQLVFGQSTHDLIFRLFTALDIFKTKKLRVVTTDSEFYSFSRQMRRMEEEGIATVTYVPVLPYETFRHRFLSTVNSSDCDLVYFSQVFFNSGYLVFDLADFVKKIQDEKKHIVIDGYHAFMAIPTDLSNLQDRVFYTAGAYKYAQSGEGACFLHVPEKYHKLLRPVFTGWLADYSGLTNQSSEVNYNASAELFAGATFDPSGIYRFKSVLTLFKKEKLTVKKIDEYVKKLQLEFFNNLVKLPDDFPINVHNLRFNSFEEHGHFFSFEFESSEATLSFAEKLKKSKMNFKARLSFL